MTMISYAQNGEDVVLDRAFPRGHLGFYLDVGASDPVVDSVTMHFYERGWSGVNVEPATGALAALERERPRDTNLGVGLADEPGEATFYELPPQMIGCSTFSAQTAGEYLHDGWEAIERTVEVSTLADVCERHTAERTIDFLKIDVEGDEHRVLKGADFQRFRPRVLVIEATVPGTMIPAHVPWEPLVLEAGYTFVLFDGLNRFFVREEDQELAGLLAAPANVLDDYIPHRSKLWRERSLQTEAAQHALAEVEAELTQLRASERSRREIEEGWRRTRDELARSRGQLNDARIELAAARQALTNVLRDPKLGAAR